jgi:hypothetical protein
MKKLAMILCILVLFAGTASGFGLPQLLNNENYNLNKNYNENSNINKNYNYNENKNWNSNTNENTASVEIAGDQRELLAAPQIVPFDIPVYQAGKIGDYTSQMYNFANIIKLSPAETIVKVLGVYNGSWFSRIRLEDLEVALLNKRAELTDVLQTRKIDVAKVRYSVKYKDAVASSGVGGGGAGSLAFDGLSSATGSVLPGYHASTHNPQFIITFYEVK